ncbi:MAG: Na/Pi cotransporter family protein, partial [Clostridia bacterium]|nr:Na/Pi cotransporter family protein [Clostridia bacterium]
MTLFTQKLIFGLVGGLGLFLFGLTLMGQGFQKIAGDKLRRFLGTTENPVLAAVTGLLLATVLQDGAAAVVLVVGLLGSGLLRLKQAVCMLLGINLGISVTVHLIAFRIEHYPLLAVGLGFLLYSFGRRRFTRYLGYSILGFGLVFTGLDTLLETMRPVAGSILLQGTISRFGRLPAWGYITGALATFVVQSSTATIGLLQVIASQSILENGLYLPLLPAALPFLFGTNLGVCATATL